MFNLRVAVKGPAFPLTYFAAGDRKKAEKKAASHARRSGTPVQVWTESSEDGGVTWYRLPTVTLTFS